MAKHHKKAVTYTLWLAITVVVVLIISVIIKLNSIEETTTYHAPDENIEILLQIVSKNAPRRGAVKPSVIIVEFGDFQCSFCKSVAPILDEALHKYPKDVQLLWVHTLNPAHPESKSAAIAGQCAHEQNQFWKYHDLMFQSQDDLSPSLYNQIAISLGLDMQEFQSCLADPQSSLLVDVNYQYANASEVKATPYISVNDQTFSGEFTAEQLDSLIQNEL